MSVEQTQAVAEEVRQGDNSEEGIASNILADRLRKLVEAGLLSCSSDAAHKQKTIYSLTEPAIQLVPLLAQMGAWGGGTVPSAASFRSAPNFSKREARGSGRRISWRS